MVSHEWQGRGLSPSTLLHKGSGWVGLLISWEAWANKQQYNPVPTQQILVVMCQNCHRAIFLPYLEMSPNLQLKCITTVMV